MNNATKPDEDAGVIDMRTLTQALACYREPHHGRSVVEILITVVPLVSCGC